MANSRSRRVEHAKPKSRKMTYETEEVHEDHAVKITDDGILLCKISQSK
jgi:hypothetical protein